MNNLIITPRTKIFDLLEAYPQLEEVLIGLTPKFKKLQNPVLRRTVTKVTTLSQAAVVGGLKVEKLVNVLRAEVGQTAVSSINGTEHKYNENKPDWFTYDLVVESIDVRDMLDAGEFPLGEVLSAIKKLNGNEVLKVIAPFIPAPLIDKTLSLGCEHWIEKQSEDMINVYFSNPE